MSRSAPTAFLALWNSISSPALQPEYESWHTFEHVPERVGLPGFVEARRYRSHRSVARPEAKSPPDYFTCYWLTDIKALNSPEYTDVFASPTAWSARMRLELRDFFRLPCQLAGSCGQSSASQLATIYFSGDALRLAEGAAKDLPQRVQRGEFVSAHWGTVAETSSFPVSNQQAAGKPTFVVMLQGLDHNALTVSAQQVAGTLAPLAQSASQAAFFELLSQVRQDELTQTAGLRQPPRPDLYKQFQSETNHAH
ncbi:MAG: hypothetical protein V4772_19125 [Pseudomonadota bacterium]